MTPLSSTLLFAFSLRDRLAAMSWLELVLWIGLASLTFALLILMGTRWGQVRPVSKCVALSIFAHILFLAYAYGTNLSFSAMGWGWEPSIRVSLSEANDESEVGLPESAEITPKPVDLSEVVEAETAPPASSLSESEPQFPPQLIEAPQPAESPPAPQLLVAQEPAPTQPPPLLPDPDVFDPTETIAEPIEIVSAPTPPVSPDPHPMPEKLTEGAKTSDSDTKPVSDTVATTKPEVVTQNPPDTNSQPRSDSTTAVATVNNPQTPRRPIDEQPLPEVYRLRTSGNRLQLAIPFGATPASEAGVQAALNWLAAAQSPDGRWDASDFGAGHETKTLGQDRQGAGASADTGITGLALLAFLGAGNTHVQGDHRETVQHGLEFLLRSQAAEGHLAGQARVFEKMYCHGIAMLALGEAYAMTGDPRLQPALRDAVAYTVNAQHPASGGWRYQPGDRGHVSQFGWQFMALRSAELGGMPTDHRTKSLMIKFLESATSGPNRGLASYRPGERPSRTMTAEAMSCRFFLEMPPSAAATREAHDYVLQELPGRGQANLYYWYYATLALYQDQGPAWNTWNNALQQNLLSRQRKEGRAAGSWDTDDVWGGYGGRIYTTAMAALCLEVYYRYLPLYDQMDATRQAEAAREVRR